MGSQRGERYDNCSGMDGWCYKMGPIKLSQEQEVYLQDLIQGNQKKSRK